MAQVNRVCKTCGKQYFFCSHCDKSLNSPQWMLMWHDDNCKKIFEIVSDYVQGNTSKDEARMKLSKCDLSSYDTFKKQIRDILDLIMIEEKKIEPQVVKEELSIKKKRNVNRRKR